MTLTTKKWIKLCESIDDVFEKMRETQKHTVITITIPYDDVDAYLKKHYKPKRKKNDHPRPARRG